MWIESSGHSRGNPRLFELVEGAPKTGKSPTVWAWPELMDYLKIAGQPVPGPSPAHQDHGRTRKKVAARRRGRASQRDGPSRGHGP